MRAGPLSHPDNVELLNRDFVNAWVLAKDLPTLAAESEDSAVQAVARQCEEHFVYPVDSHVLSPTGEFIAGLWVEDALVFHIGSRPAQIKRPPPEFSGNPDAIYRQFLVAARDQALGKEP